jgi:hypothetical protein
MNNVNSISQPSIKRKRPKLVWVITIFYVISAGWTLLSFALIYSGGIPLNEAQASYFKSQTILDILFTIAIGSLNFIGVIYLFLLRRTAFYLFLSAFVFGMLMTVYHIFFKNGLGAIGSPGLIGAIIGWAISIAIIIYVRKLINRDILN